MDSESRSWDVSDLYHGENKPSEIENGSGQKSEEDESWKPKLKNWLEKDINNPSSTLGWGVRSKVAETNQVNREENNERIKECGRAQKLISWF